MQKTLYKRLKPEYKEMIDERYKDYPFTHKEIIEVLNSEKYFSEVRFATAMDVTHTCNLEFFGDAFDEV